MKKKNPLVEEFADYGTIPSCIGKYPDGSPTIHLRRRRYAKHI